MNRVMTSLVVLMLALGTSAPAAARNGGLYLELAPSWGFFLTDEVRIENGENNDPVDYATASFVPAIKVGVNLFGWAGAEAQLSGHYWDVGGDVGGGGYVGGVFRATPLEVLSYVLPDTVQLPSLLPRGPVTWKNRPFDLGVSVGGGYTLIGEDYAYQGGYFQWGLDVKFFITPNLAVGLDLPFRHMLYQPFRYTDFNNKKGLCTDGGDAYGFIGATRVDVPVGPRVQAVEVNASDSDKCNTAAPSALLIAPALTIAGVIDFGI